MTTTRVSVESKAKYNYIRLPVRDRENIVTRVINDADRACVRVYVWDTRAKNVYPRAFAK